MKSKLMEETISLEQYTINLVVEYILVQQMLKRFLRHREF